MKGGYRSGCGALRRRSPLGLRFLTCPKPKTKRRAVKVEDDVHRRNYPVGFRRSGLPGFELHFRRVYRCPRHNMDGHECFTVASLTWLIYDIVLTADSEVRAL
jgi:hypothetical protein